MARAGRNASGTDMLLSMAVLLIPVVLIVVFFARPGSEQPKAVDYAAVLTTARAESPYKVLAPESAPKGWVPTRVRWAKTGEPWLDTKPAVGNSWQLGFLDENQVYIAIQQRDAQATQLIDQVTREGHEEVGTVEAAGLTWKRYLSKDARTRSLVAATDEMAAIVSGDAHYAQLEAFARLLKAA